MFSTVLFFFTALLLPVSNAATVIDAQDVFYCPFDVSSSLPSDTSSLDITYTSGNTQKNSIAFHDGNACYVHVHFTLGETIPSVVMSEVEYKGNQNASIETNIALEMAYSPVCITSTSP